MVNKFTWFSTEGKDAGEEETSDKGGEEKTPDRGGGGDT